MPLHPMANADRYIRRIRNKAKKQYAAAYDRWIVTGRRGPEPSRGAVSGMGAQAARMQLEDIYQGWRHDGARLVREA